MGFYPVEPDKHHHSSQRDAEEGLHDHNKAMGLLDHLEELRLTVVKCAGALLLGCVVVGVFFPFFAKILNWPLQQAMVGNPGLLQGLVTNSPMGIFSVLLQICFLGGLALSLPFILYFLAQFIAPALSQKEKHILLPGCIAVLVLFFIGALFSYFLVLPTTLAISIHLNEAFNFQLIWSAPHYYGLVVWMTLGIGMCFEFPLAIIFLSYLGIVSAEKLKNIRRHMVVIILITSALITPGGDPFTLVILAIPLYLLYEVAIWVCSRIEKKRKLVEEFSV